MQDRIGNPLITKMSHSGVTGEPRAMQCHRWLTGQLLANALRVETELEKSIFETMKSVLGLADNGWIFPGLVISWQRAFT